MHSFYGECGMTKLTYAQAVELVEQASQESLQNRGYRLDKPYGIFFLMRLLKMFWEQPEISFTGQIMQK